MKYRPADRFSRTGLGTAELAGGRFTGNSPPDPPQPFAKRVSIRPDCRAAFLPSNNRLVCLPRTVLILYSGKRVGFRKSE